MFSNITKSYVVVQNVIHKEDIQTLLDYYNGEILTALELNNLRKPAKKFIIKEDIEPEDKI